MLNAQQILIVPLDHSGKWIAWNFEETKIVATGSTYAEAKRAALAAGEKRPVLDKAPLAKMRFIGGHG